MDFDVDGPGRPGALFGLPHSADTARVRVLPVPWEATTSFRTGTAGGPAAILEASAQVDLWDAEVDAPWTEGIHLDAVPDWLPPLDIETRARVEAVREGDLSLIPLVDYAGARVNQHVQGWANAVFDGGQIPAILGGDHSVPLGAIHAATSRFPGLGVLHIDAHADLRPAYEGFAFSHASIFHNVMRLPVSALSQIAIRDQGMVEAAAQASDARIHVLSDLQISQALAAGATFQELVDRVLAPLPSEVWISVDIDGLDPSLCPNTGTPVPGGLDWRQLIVLLGTLGRSGRRIVGFDLCEVGPHEWDATVGARVLYKLSAWAIHSDREKA